MKTTKKLCRAGIFRFFPVLKLLAGTFLFALILCGAGVISAQAATATSGESNGCKWMLDNDGTLTLSGSGEWRWGKCPSRDAVTKLVVKDGITALNTDFFRYSANLKSVDIADSVKSIKNYCFYQCTSLKSVKLSANLEEIPNSAFSGCTSLTSVTVPGKTTAIGQDAFWNCTSLSSISIPSGGITIKEYAFWDCQNLDLVIPDGTKLNKNAVYNVRSLTFENGADVPGKMPNWGWTETIIFKKGIVSGDMSYNSGSATGITRIALKNVIFEEGVTEINCKFGDSEITEVHLPDSVTKISNAFWYCTKLTKITGGNNLKEIGTSAFACCTALKSFTVPDSVKTIGLNAFASCTALKEVDLPKNLKEIGTYAFYQTKLESVTIPSGVTAIKTGAFQNCSSMAKVSLPDTLTTIGDYAFSGCAMTSVTIPKSVTSIGDYAFGSKFVENTSTKEYKSDSVFTICGYTGTAAETYAELYNFKFVDISSVSVGSSFSKSGSSFVVTKTGEEVAYKKPISKSKTSVTIPATVTVNGTIMKVTSIKSKAFKGNRKLKKVTLGKNVKVIGSQAFSGCTRLKSITIGPKVSKIGAKAFYNCRNLKKITIKTSKLTKKTVGSKAFKGICKKATIKVPKAKLKSYKTMLKAKGVGSKVKIKK